MPITYRYQLRACATGLLIAALAGPAQAQVRRGAAAFGDWKADAPGVRRHITPADLPPPGATPSTAAGAQMTARPNGAWPRVPAGFKVDLYAAGLTNPREVVRAPNGDLFVAETWPGRIHILRGVDAKGQAAQSTVYASGLSEPFGMAFYPNGANPKYLYVANINSIVRYAYSNGDLKATGEPQVIVPSLLEPNQRGGHSTRNLRFSADGKTLYCSIGSRSNTWENPADNEDRRADILAMNPDGSGIRVFAYGIRNAVGLAIHPQTGDLWCSVNERDGLGDDLVPDYITRVREGAFFGWPWYYIGDNQDPRHPGKRPDLRGKVTVPDVLLQAHSASLGLTFYDGTAFPKEYRMDGFAAEHGSWNRAMRTGYKVIRVPLKRGVPTGEYEDFMTGFVTPEGKVWGRPVGVVTDSRGALVVTDDGSGNVWRVTYTGK